ncbi:MAG: nuclear transport factor 2 family protein [Pseudomonadota bacterium]|nr:nuclear transport factor 2 family protein [Pseudomonadota bacterium]
MPTDLIHQISLVEERLRRAMLASDCLALDELISPDLIFTNHFGQVCGKEDDLNMHRDGLLKLHTLEPSEIRVSTRGELAVVSVRMKVGGAFDNMAFQEDLRYTRVWSLSERGSWEILTGHSSRVQQ